MTNGLASSSALDVELSKFLSLVLRHAPEQAGLKLDANGWADVRALLDAVERQFGASEADVKRVVETSPKRRFSIDGNRIRAVQGHSVGVDLKLERRDPPAQLFHGTAETFLPSILLEGLTKRERHHVHLSMDEETARTVAARRKGRAVVITVAAARMAETGHVFFLSENDVWLTDHVPPAFLAVQGEAEQS